eukprot:TRINITY_DN2241_c0_g1_i1.p2 TRINITY_DN2241_c0_g1~~TRINITY_DN2241_c0_g1_i1.p2  ORF type:complete len:360 (+),score=102.51 TRINITY_DN2241_c0_g1_i1:59-1081(+)
MKIFGLLALTLAISAVIAVPVRFDDGGASRLVSDNKPVLDDAMIEAINNNPKIGWKAGRNSYFEKYTLAQVKDMMGALTGVDTPDFVKEYVTMNTPAQFDSRQQWPGCIGPILNQARCGSCWAFGAVEAISDRLCIASGTNASYVQLAALDLVACDHGFFSGENGCQGGQLGAAWDWARKEGIVTEACLPYGVAEGGPIPTCAPTAQPCMPPSFVPTPACNKTCANGANYEQDKHKISTVYSLGSAEAMAQEIATNGPIEAAFTVYADFPSYKSGVYKQTSQQVLGGHAIKIIGYGTENGEDYWLVQNSWTTTWGDKGYFKILRGVNECGIEDNAVAGKP